MIGNDGESKEKEVDGGSCRSNTRWECVAKVWINLYTKYGLKKGVWRGKDSSK